MKSIDIFPWNENFNTGLPEIDAQHRKLVQLLNLLASHVAFQTGIPDLNDIFNQLVDYAGYHFQTEEAIWQQYLPGDALEIKHKQVHNSFLEMVNRLKAAEETKPVNILIEETLAFLTRWLVAHILESDRHLAMLVLAQQSGMTLEAAKKHVSEQMGAGTKALIDLILFIYESLSANTSHLMRELAQRKQNEETLRKLSSAVEQSPTSVVITDLDAKIEYVNEAFIQKSGYSRDEVIGQNPRIMQSGKTAKAHFEAMWASLKQGEVWKGEFVNRKKSGEEYIELAVISPIRQADGVITHYLGIKEDITDRKKSEDELRIAAKAFEAQEGIMVTDANGVILRVNHAFEEITGYTSAEAIGKTPRLLNSGQHEPEFFADMWQSVIENGAWEGEIINRRKNQENYPEYLKITAVKSVGGVITNYVAMFSDITLRKISEEEIRSLAFYDPLTKLPNRRLLIDRMQQALAETNRNGTHAALLFFDLDNFKTLNDTLGHDKGDQLLQQVAQRLMSCVREVDTVARLGGDEFVVMLKDLSESPEKAAIQAEIACVKTLTALNQPYKLTNLNYYSTPSIGIALFSGTDVSVEELMKRADIAMYQAKHAGRNTFRFFDPKMQSIVEKRSTLEEGLRRALPDVQLRLHYQMQVDHVGDILGAEVLLRWRHPERGMISPNDFIPLAEETGLIVPIGLWVLENACEQLKRWQIDPKKRHLHLAVNVSARQFQQPDFYQQVLGLLQKTGIEPSRLKLELTESCVVDNIEDTIEKMKALKKIGVQFSMDDFGTGYSSLSSLKKLPLDQLKIDQSFVRDITTDPDDAIIVQTIIAMANNMKLSVIAEGVETEQQKAFLTKNNCLYFQGYLFGKPITIEQFEAILNLGDN